MLKEFWNKLFRKKEDCYWFLQGWCYKYYPTGYNESKGYWIKCKDLCEEFGWEEKE